MALVIPMACLKQSEALHLDAEVGQELATVREGISPWRQVLQHNPRNSSQHSVGGPVTGGALVANMPFIAERGLQVEKGREADQRRVTKTPVIVTDTAVIAERGARAGEGEGGGPAAGDEGADGGAAHRGGAAPEAQRGGAPAREAGGGTRP